MQQNRRCSPNWDIDGSSFGSFYVVYERRDTILEEVLHRLEGVSIPGEMSLYLRGGILEEYTPHEQSDIDLILIGDSHPSIVDAIKTSLIDLNRPIELLHVSYGQLIQLPPICMLLKYRSILVRGPALELPEIPVDTGLIHVLWRLYHPMLCQQILQGTVWQRLHSVKYLIRSIGVFGLFEGRYTRDLRTCLAWSTAYVPQTTPVLERIFRDLSYAQVEPVLLRPTIITIIEKYHSMQREAKEE